MPWRREEVAPYHYEQVYIPDSTEQFYYSRVERTAEEMERRYRQVNGKPGNYAELPEDTPDEKAVKKFLTDEFGTAHKKKTEAAAPKPKKKKANPKKYKL